MGIIGKGLGKLIGIALGAAAAAGTVAAVKGAVDANKAKKINNEAKQIQASAVSRYDESLKFANARLYLLGNNKKTAVEMFPEFSNLIGKIQGKPEFKGKYDTTYNLPPLDYTELKSINENMRVAIAGGAAVAGGALIGFAAFGASALVASPAILAGGFVIYAKGAKLKKEAMENREKAAMLENKIGEIVKYHNDVAKYADFLTSSFSRINSAYRSHLMKLSRVLHIKNNWNEFTKVEKQIVENSVLLTRLLTEMCKVQIVVKTSKTTEYVNTEGVKEMQDKAFTILPKLATS